METPAPRAHPESPDAIRQQLYAWIEQGGDEFCARLHAVLRYFFEDAASPPPAARLGQDSAPPEPRP